MKICYILRGLPGSGKSTFAASLRPLSCVVCSADDYFMRDGAYRFDPNKLGKAHTCCMLKFKQAISAQVQIIVVDNTNTTKREYREYQRLAKESGYKVIIKKFECSIEDSVKRNTHNVPEATIRKMHSRFED